MARIIKPGSAGKDRLLLQKGIVVAMRELAKQATLNNTTYDLVAYIALSLEAIGNTIDDSVAAWEKRGYWLKADKYRMEWNWSIGLSQSIKQALINQQWDRVAQLTAQISQKMSKVTVPDRNRIGTPWVGAWDRLKHPEQYH